MAKPTLYLMLGYPGAGKTTVAEIMARLGGAVHVASDKVRLELFQEPTFSQAEHDAVYETLNQRTRDLLISGRTVIYDANLNRLMHREEKYQLCREVGATPKLIWVQTDAATAKKRANHESRTALWPRHETPEQMFERVVSAFEPPKVDEPYIALSGLDITDAYIRQQLGL